MTTKHSKLPKELQQFVDGGSVTFRCDDGDWDIHIAERDSSDFRKDLPARSIMIAENGCGDCLFLKCSSTGNVAPKVFVFWHEEGRHEMFAKHVKDLIADSLTAANSARIEKSSDDSISLEQLKAALAKPDKSGECNRWRAIGKFRKSSFTLEALPTLRRALLDEDLNVICEAARCIAKLGPEALKCPAGEAQLLVDGFPLELERQLLSLGYKYWPYNGFPVCYQDCLEALVALDADGDLITEFVEHHIGLGDDCFVTSAQALGRVGSKDAINLLKRAADYWLPELNAKHAKEVKAVLAAAKAKK